MGTPSLVVDEDLLQRNLTRVAHSAAARSLALRPHVKTHKSFEIARRQLATGATGITVATESEAAAFAGAGFADILIAYPLGSPRLWDACGNGSASWSRSIRVTTAAGSRRRTRAGWPDGSVLTGMRPGV